MDAILGNVFLAVQQRIVDQCPEIKWIDQDMGQLDFYNGERPLVIFPAVVLDIVDLTYEELGLNTQICTAVLEVRLAVAAYVQAAQVHSQQHKERALEYYNIEHRLNKALHGWCDSQYFAPLIRRHVKTERRKDSLRIRPLRYEFAFTDDTTLPVRTTVPRPDANIDVNTPID
jgi:hypothetical protein